MKIFEADTLEVPEHTTPRQPGVISSVQAAAQTISEMLEERSSALTVPELAEMLGVSRRHLYDMVSANRIPHIRIGTAVRLDTKMVADWLRQRTVTTR